MIATAVVGVIGAGVGVAKYVDGKKTQSDAQGKIDDFQFDPLNNAYINNQVSTLGADLRREEATRLANTQVGALQASGTRGLVGGLGRVTANNNQINRETAANLDEQQKAINMAASGDQANIRAMTEQRQSNELAGYGSLLNVGMGMKADGLTDVLNAAGTIGTAAKGMQIGTGTGGGTGTGNSEYADANGNPIPIGTYDPRRVSDQPQNTPIANQPTNWGNPYYSAGAGQYGLGYGMSNGVDSFYQNLMKFKNRAY